MNGMSAPPKCVSCLVAGQDHHTRQGKTTTHGRARPPHTAWQDHHHTCSLLELLDEVEELEAMGFVREAELLEVLYNEKGKQRCEV